MAWQALSVAMKINKIPGDTSIFKLIEYIRLKMPENHWQFILAINLFLYHYAFIA